jgi:hypothetical protein
MEFPIKLYALASRPNVRVQDLWYIITLRLKQGFSSYVKIYFILFIEHAFKYEYCGMEIKGMNYLHFLLVFSLFDNHRIYGVFLK